MPGIQPEDFTPSVIAKLMHSDDLIWHNIANDKLFDQGQQIFFENRGSSLISTNFRIINPSDAYINIIIQCYLFFTNTPIRQYSYFRL